MAGFSSRLREKIDSTRSNTTSGNVPSNSKSKNIRGLTRLGGGAISSVSGTSAAPVATIASSSAPASGGLLRGRSNSNAGGSGGGVGGSGGGGGGGTSSGTTATGGGVVPLPVQTPSLRKENAGQDGTSANALPTNTGTTTVGLLDSIIAPTLGGSKIVPGWGAGANSSDNVPSGHLTSIKPMVDNTAPPTSRKQWMGGGDGGTTTVGGSSLSSMVPHSSRLAPGGKRVPWAMHGPPPSSSLPSSPDKNSGMSSSSRRRWGDEEDDDGDDAPPVTTAGTAGTAVSGEGGNSFRNNGRIAGGGRYDGGGRFGAGGGGVNGGSTGRYDTGSSGGRYDNNSNGHAGTSDASWRRPSGGNFNDNRAENQTNDSSSQYNYRDREEYGSRRQPSSGSHYNDGGYGHHRNNDGGYHRPTEDVHHHQHHGNYPRDNGGYNHRDNDHHRGGYYERGGSSSTYRDNTYERGSYRDDDRRGSEQPRSRGGPYDNPPNQRGSYDRRYHDDDPRDSRWSSRREGGGGNYNMSNSRADDYDRRNNNNNNGEFDGNNIDRQHGSVYSRGRAPSYEAREMEGRRKGMENSATTGGSALLVRSKPESIEGASSEGQATRVSVAQRPADRSMFQQNPPIDDSTPMLLLRSNETRGVDKASGQESVAVSTEMTPMANKPEATSGVSSSAATTQINKLETLNTSQPPPVWSSKSAPSVAPQVCPPKLLISPEGIHKQASSDSSAVVAAKPLSTHNIQPASSVVPSLLARNQVETEQDKKDRAMEQQQSILRLVADRRAAEASRKGSESLPSEKRSEIKWERGRKMSVDGEDGKKAEVSARGANRFGKGNDHDSKERTGKAKEKGHIDRKAAEAARKCEPLPEKRNEIEQKRGRKLSTDGEDGKKAEVSARGADRPIKGKYADLKERTVKAKGMGQVADIKAAETSRKGERFQETYNKVEQERGRKLSTDGEDGKKVEFSARGADRLSKGNNHGSKERTVKVKEKGQVADRRAAAVSRKGESLPEKKTKLKWERGKKLSTDGEDGKKVEFSARGADRLSKGNDHDSKERTDKVKEKTHRESVEERKTERKNVRRKEEHTNDDDTEHPNNRKADSNGRKIGETKSKLKGERRNPCRIEGHDHDWIQCPNNPKSESFVRNNPCRIEEHDHDWIDCPDNPKSEKYVRPNSKKGRKGSKSQTSRATEKRKHGSSVPTAGADAPSHGKRSSKQKTREIIRSTEEDSRLEENASKPTEGVKTNEISSSTESSTEPSKPLDENPKPTPAKKPFIPAPSTPVEKPFIPAPPPAVSAWMSGPPPAITQNSSPPSIVSAPETSQPSKSTTFSSPDSVSSPLPLLLEYGTQASVTPSQVSHHARQNNPSNPPTQKKGPTPILLPPALFPGNNALFGESLGSTAVYDSWNPPPRVIPSSYIDPWKPNPFAATAVPSPSTGARMTAGFGSIWSESAVSPVSSKEKNFVRPDNGALGNGELLLLEPMPSGVMERSASPTFLFNNLTIDDTTSHVEK